MTNAEIAAALESWRCSTSSTAPSITACSPTAPPRKAIRESPVSVAELAAAGRATELPGVGKTLAEKIDALLETGEIPAAAKLKAKFPPSLVEVTRVPGLGAKTARRLYDELGVASSTTSGGGRGAADPRAEGARPEGRGERARRARAARRARGGAGPPAALQGPPDRRGAGGGAARAPRRQPGRGGRLGAALGRDLQGHRPDRDRRGAGRPRRASGRPPAGRRGGQAGAERGAGADPQRRLGRPADRPPRGLRQPAPALHRLGGPQRAAARGRGGARPLGLRARGHRGRDRRGRPLRDRGARSTAGSATPTSSRSCARGAASCRRRAEGELPELVAARRRPRRPALPHHPLRRPQHARGDGRRRPASAATPTWRSPTTPPATASATTSPPSGSGSGSRRSAPGTRASAAFACSPARR